MQRREVVVLILSIVFAATISGAQTDVTWHTLTSSNGEFAVTVPATYKAYKNKRRNSVLVFGSGNEAYFDTTFEKTEGADNWIASLRRSASERAEQNEFSVGDARVYTYKLTDGNAIMYSVDVLTRKGSYSVVVTSRAADNPALASMLASIRLNNERLLKDVSGQDPTSSATLKVSSLRSSDIIRAAIQRRQQGQVEVVEGADRPFDKRSEIYSRRLIILEKPVAKYNEAGRSKMIQGNVKLRVLLKANGDIGRITVVNGLPHGLTDQAIEAAKLIRFLPAEVLGVPIDREVTVEYSFVIY